MKIGILGGGLSGLALRYFLKGDTVILEKAAECGGLCRSVKVNGFVFDQGGHILFSKDKAILHLIRHILAGNIVMKRRNNKIYYKNTFIKYPFENGLSGLSKKDNYDCLLGFLQNDSPRPINFKQWLFFNFGRAISEKYLVPYNEKIWKYDLSMMGLEWVERVPKPPLEDIIKSSLGMETEGYLHQLFYFYPRSGGIQSLIQRLENKKNGPIITNFEVRKICKRGSGWEVSNGNRSLFFDKIISTIPIFDLLNSMNLVPKGVSQALRKLKYNSLRAVMIGLSENNLTPYSAVYFPAKKFPFHRVCFMSNFTRNNAPAGHSSLVAEITSPADAALHKTNDKDLIDNVISNLHSLGIINSNKVCLSKVERVKYAYVIYDLGYKRNVSIVKAYLEAQGIFLNGRFAEFEYINMDEVLRRSWRLSGRLNAQA